MAHAIRAELIALDEWDWAGAEREIAMAAQLDPASTFVRSNAARLHICTGSYDRAMIEAQLALMAEPSSLTLLLILVSVFIRSGRYQHAIAILSNLLESDSDFHAARRDRAQAYLLDGRPNEAIGDLDLLAPDRSEE
jgi:tetratricopeptide (TPR) repeat protein